MLYSYDIYIYIYVAMYIYIVILYTKVLYHFHVFVADVGDLDMCSQASGLSGFRKDRFHEVKMLNT